MTTKAEFYVPSDDILLEIGRLQVLHGHLDHSLRLAIKRILGISIVDAGYWNETRGMAAGLRKRVRTLIAEKYSDDEDAADTLNKVLDDAEQVTLLRNRVMHSVWMKTPGQEPMLHDRDETSKRHVNYVQPTASGLASISERIERIQHVLNHLTRTLI